MPVNICELLQTSLFFNWRRQKTNSATLSDHEVSLKTFENINAKKWFKLTKLTNFWNVRMKYNISGLGHPTTVVIIFIFFVLSKNLVNLTKVKNRQKILCTLSTITFLVMTMTRYINIHWVWLSFSVNRTQLGVIIQLLIAPLLWDFWQFSSIYNPKCP